MGVDLFLLLSGALLLGRDWDIKGFLAKRVPRIVKPFIFWSIVCSIVLITVSYLIPGVDFVTQFGIYDVLKVFWDTLMCKAPGSAVYWFFWMMLGVYLIMPVFNKWVKNADLDELEYFLVIWIVSTIFDYTLMRECPIKLSYFTSPIGLVVLGYYLRYTERKIFNSSLIALLLILFSNAVMFIYSYHVRDTKILFEFHRYSIPVIVESIGVFCLFKTSSFLNSPSDNVRNIVSSIAVCSYGMYLIHSQIIMAVRKILHVKLNFYMEFAVLFIAGFILSWIIIYILSKIPFLDEYVGVK